MGFAPLSFCPSARPRGSPGGGGGQDPGAVSGRVTAQRVARPHDSPLTGQRTFGCFRGWADVKDAARTFVCKCLGSCFQFFWG